MRQVFLTLHWFVSFALFLWNSVFGAVEPRDLLGFGVPLREVLGTRDKHRVQQQREQPDQEVDTSGEANVQREGQPYSHEASQQKQHREGEVPSFVVDVAVVGAGVAGLAAAAYLRRCGASVVVFEGRHRVGGRTFSSVMPERVLPDGRKVERTRPRCRCWGCRDSLRLCWD